MGSTSRYGRATINPNDPNALGICDRCSFLFNLCTLRWQMEWCGTTMQNLHLRVCPQCWDVPQEQLRTIILPADPPSVRDPRTEPFFIDQVNELTLSKVIGKPYMFLAESTMLCEIDSGLGIVTALGGTGNMSSAFTLGIVVSPAFSDTGELTAALLLGIGLTAPFGDTSAMTAEVDVVSPPSGPSILWTDNDLSYAQASPYTITAAAIGTASAGRVVAVGLSGFKSLLGDQISGVTIGGVTAKRITLVNGGVGTPGVYPFAEIWWANVPTGTTANIVISYADTGMGLLANVYALNNVDTSFPMWDSVANVAQSGAVSGTIAMPANSVSMGAAYTGINSVGTTSSWTNLTEDSDTSVDPGLGAFVDGGAASRTDVSSAGSVAVSANAASADVSPIKSLAAASFTAADGNKYIVLTASDPAWAVPADWNDADNSIHAIGSSANATDPGAVGGGGTGGGAWARTDNLNLTGGGTATVVIGSNGSDTYLSNTGVAPTSTSEGVLAKGGTTNTGITGGTGGASGSCIGTAANSGGNGGAGQNADNGYGGGGGGAGGPNGVGAAGAAAVANTSGGGGGGANGGTAGSGAAGGSSRLNVPGGTSTGDPGGFGSGGAGKSSTSTAVTAAGSQEAIWINDATGALAGPGAGGGGGRGAGSTTAAATGGQGGLYGGGAGGSGEDATAHASGRDGVVVIRYRP